MKYFLVTFGNSEVRRYKAISIQEAFVSATQDAIYLDYRIISIYEE